MCLLCQRGSFINQEGEKEKLIEEGGFFQTLQSTTDSTRKIDFVLCPICSQALRQFIKETLAEQKKKWAVIVRTITLF